MLFIARNSSNKAIVFTSICRRLCQGLHPTSSSTSHEQQDIDEKKAKQQKYQELEKLQFRPMYLDAQATTPMVNSI